MLCVCMCILMKNIRCRGVCIWNSDQRRTHILVQGGFCAKVSTRQSHEKVPTYVCTPYKMYDDDDDDDGGIQTLGNCGNHSTVRRPPSCLLYLFSAYRLLRLKVRIGFASSSWTVAFFMFSLSACGIRNILQPFTCRQRIVAFKPLWRFLFTKHSFGFVCVGTITQSRSVGERSIWRWVRIQGNFSSKDAILWYYFKECHPFVCDTCQFGYLIVGYFSNENINWNSITKWIGWQYVL